MVKTISMTKKRKFGSTITKAKSREKSPQSGEEVNSARDRFKGALQELLPHSEEDTESSDEDNWNKKKIPNQKKKQPQQPPQQGEKPAETEQNKAFVMKLYDRSVDLAQFNENTPLYPICRAWVANTPHRVCLGIEKSENKKKKDESITKKKSDESSELKEEKPTEEELQYWKDYGDSDHIKEVYKLPTPETWENDKIRIPDLIPYDTKLLKFYEEGVEPPSKEDILKENISHWVNVRRTWLEASLRNDIRYEKSIRILTNIFSRTQQQLQGL